MKAANETYSKVRLVVLYSLVSGLGSVHARCNTALSMNIFYMTVKLVCFALQ